MAVSSREMEVFERVSALGSFTAAGEELRLTPSAVSRVVSRIEDRLGVRLFSRTTRELHLTSEGETYLARSKTILQAIRDAEQEVSQGGSTITGVLRISTGSTFGRHWLMPALPAFAEAYPGIELQVEVTDRVVDLAAERVDVAIRSGPMPDSNIIARRLTEVSRVICASPSYLKRRGTPAGPKDLADHRCLLVAGTSSLSKWPFRTPRGTETIQIHASASSDSADSVRDMVLGGMGIARLARICVEHDLAVGQLVAILEDCHADQTVALSAIMLPERQKDPRVRAFVDHLTQSMRPAGGIPLANPDK